MTTKKQKDKLKILRTAEREAKAQYILAKRDFSEANTKVDRERDDSEKLKKLIKLAKIAFDKKVKAAIKHVAARNAVNKFLFGKVN